MRILIYILIVIALMIIGLRTKELNNTFKVILWTIITLAMISVLYVLLT